MHRRALPFIALLASQVALAEAPAMVPVTGYLTDDNGAPINDQVTLQLKLYPVATAGASIWEEIQQVDVDNGQFTVYLGDSTTLDLSTFRDNGTLFLGMGVDSGAEMSPRFSIATAPFAGYAQYCDDAEMLGGSPAADYRLAADNIDWADVAGVPVSLIDGDQDTTYTSGTGLTLSSANQFAADQTAIEGWAKGVAYDTVGELRTQLDGVYAAKMSCSANQVLLADGAGSWACTDATALPVSEAAVDAAVANNGYALASAVTTLAGRVTTAEGNISALQTTVAGHTTSLGTLNTTVSGHTTSLSTLNTTVSGHTTSIAAINTTDAAQSASIAALQNALPAPVISYDATKVASYPGSGSTWFDLSGNGINGQMQSCSVAGVLGSVKTMVFNRSDCAKILFRNKMLDPDVMTGVMWVYSKLTTADNNGGGLYVNRPDNVNNGNNWIWFGKWSTDLWYFRVDNGPCCQDLAGSGTANFSTLVPANQWVMVHFAYANGGTWKWGVQGVTKYSGTLDLRQSVQEADTSAIGVGHAGSGSYWDGGISSVQFYNAMLTDAQIAALFASTKATYGL
jgi:hypothetical protein